MTRDEYVESLKSSFVTLGTNAAFVALAAQVPFLNFPVVNIITKMIIGRILRAVATETETAAFFMYIDMRVNAQAKDFELAALTNRKAQESGSAEEKANAEKELIQKFRDFVRITA